jgi:D-alanyl-lipoteichoic acid acyltransferase DltB (MBOAT superfamily)
MLFNSFPFLVFFIVVTLSYYLLNNRWRWILLLLASCYFYAFLIPAYLFVLFLIILIDYTAGIFIESHKGNLRRLYLGISIFSNLAVLGIFKYHNFFVENINLISHSVSGNTGLLSIWKMALPVGLSFHTFQAMSYTIEVYKGRQTAERRIGIYALYVMFYPQLVAGPIERPQNLIHQFYEKHPVNYSVIIAGLKCMLWGYFMKTVVADRLGIYVDYVFRNAEVHSRLALVIAVIFYAFQIYCDFAGYSFIAIGTAKVMGIGLTMNFKRPYLAFSPIEFWRRWNITLSQWFRDYIYFPMGGNRVSIWKFVFNILVVFILSGFWHGANWTFIIWGLVHGIFVLSSYLKEKTFPRLEVSKFVGTITTFILVSFAWIFFRSSNLQEAFLIIKRIISPKTIQAVDGEFDERSLLVYSAIGILIIILTDLCAEYRPLKFQLLHSKNEWVRMVTCVGIIVAIILFGVFDGSQFIYFQF